MADAQSREVPMQRVADVVAGKFCYTVMASSAVTFAFWALAGALDYLRIDAVCSSKIQQSQACGCGGFFRCASQSKGMSLLLRLLPEQCISRTTLRSMLQQASRASYHQSTSDLYELCRHASLPRGRHSSRQPRSQPAGSQAGGGRAGGCLPLRSGPGSTHGCAGGQLSGRKAGPAAAWWRCA